MKAEYLGLDGHDAIRLGAFFCVFIVVSLFEAAMPRRKRTQPRSGRWFSNLTILALNPISVRLIFPLLPLNLALIAQERGWGLLNYFTLPYWLSVALGAVLLDFTIYIQHVLFHAIPTFWRLHMMHHSDMDIDLTTGVRFHPIEIILSLGIKLLAVIALGPPALAVLVFEVLLNATSMFNHGNLNIPRGVDRVLRLFVVTPDMHRVHHSVIIRETNSNFGFNHPWWDRLMGTYKDQPAMGHEEMTIGLSQFRDPKRLGLLNLLALPFVGDPGGQAINRH